MKLEELRRECVKAKERYERQLFRSHTDILSSCYFEKLIDVADAAKKLLAVLELRESCYYETFELADAIKELEVEK